MKRLVWWSGLCVLAILAAAGCSKQGRIDRHLARGNAHFEAGRYEEATIEYRNVLQEDISNTVAVVRSGLAHYELGNIREAAVFLREGVKLAPDDLEARRKLAAIYRMARLISEARGEALAILERDPDDFDALLLLVDTSNQPEELADVEARLVERADQYGDRYQYHLAMAQIHVRKADVDAAEASLQQALELAPNEVTILSALADFYQGRGNQDESEAYLQRAVENAPPVSPVRVKWAGLRYGKGEHEEALKSLRQMVEEDPRFASAWLMLGQFALTEHRLDDCQKAVDAVLSEQPGHPGGLLLQARLWLAQGESVKASEAFEKLLAKDPNSGMLHHQLGLARLRSGQIDDARTELRQAVSLDPRLTEAALQLAELNLRTGQAATATRDVEKLISERGAFPEAMVVLAKAYLANGETDRALATFRGLEELDPENYVGPYLRGEVLLRQQRNREAREAFETAWGRSPQLVPIVARLAVLDLREDNGEAAVSRLQKAIEQMPDQAGLHQMLGVIYAQLGQPEQAEAEFRKEIEVSPQDMTPYLALARLLSQQARADEALAQVEQALAVKPDDIRALILSGVLYERKGDYEQALTRYERILELEPRFAQAANNAAYLCAERLGQLDKAFALAKKARELAPNDAAIADTLGWVAYLRGEYPWALTLVQEGAEKYPDNAEVQYHVGMAQLANGNEAAAREALAQAIGLDDKQMMHGNLARDLADLLAVPVDQVTPEHQSLIDAVLASDGDNPAARVRQAVLLERGNDAAAWAAAGTAYQSILKTHPQYLPATLQLVDLYAGSLADPARALEMLKQARVNRPDDPALTRRAGWLGFRAGDYAWAYGLLQASARALPADPAVRYHLAVAAYHVGKVAEAERMDEQALGTGGADFPDAADAKRFLLLLQAAVKSPMDQQTLALAEGIAADDPLYVPAQMVVAHGKEAAGQAAEAAAICTSVLDRAPTFAPAAREAARLYAEVLGDGERAYPLATQAREALPDDDVVARVLGGLAYQRKDYAYATQLLEQALRSQPDRAEILYPLGLSRRQQGDAAGARQALERALQLAPDSPYATQAKDVLGGTQ